jgi:hypothetical protein
VHVTVRANRRCGGDDQQSVTLTEAQLTYVALNDDGQPVSVWP